MKTHLEALAEFQIYCVCQGRTSGRTAIVNAEREILRNCTTLNERFLIKQLESLVPNLTFYNTRPLTRYLYRVSRGVNDTRSNVIERVYLKWLLQK